MGIYQINYDSSKKMLQISTRIFTDDINKALEKKYKQKSFIGGDKESQESVELLKKYLAEKLILKVNGQARTLTFLSKETDADVLVCYLRIKEVPKLESLHIYNALLIDCFAEQQNLLHITVNGSKKSVLFTENSLEEMLKF